eukprot:m.28093 g.28093  ORF g.28093 m.28093 type:complete len:64 (-) comp15861_c0_seq1:210-401(-)
MRLQNKLALADNWRTVESMILDRPCFLTKHRGCVVVCQVNTKLGDEDEDEEDQDGKRHNEKNP